jgi:hypothetical protein
MEYNVFGMTRGCRGNSRWNRAERWIRIAVPAESEALERLVRNLGYSRTPLTEAVRARVEGLGGLWIEVVVADVRSARQRAEAQAELKRATPSRGSNA